MLLEFGGVPFGSPPIDADPSEPYGVAASWIPTVPSAAQA